MENTLNYAKYRTEIDGFMAEELGVLIALAEIGLASLPNTGMLYDLSSETLQRVKRTTFRTVEVCDERKYKK